LDLLAAAGLRLFDAFGYENVTMEQIADAADVSKGTLYNHFPVKEAVLAHWIHRQLEADLESLLPEIVPLRGFPEKLRALLTASQAWCENHRGYLPYYLRYRFLGLAAPASGHRAVTDNGMVQAVSALIAAAQDNNELRADYSADHLATLFNHMYLGALMRWLMVDDLSLQEEFAAIITVFVDGASLQS
jgi:AcrR family transcriptional regulator